MKLTKIVQLELKDFHLEYKLGLSSQISRSSISRPSNIAEGSADELENQLLLTLD
jgi:four helix bundle protein